MRSKTTALIAATLVLAGSGACAGIASADPPAPPPEPLTAMGHDGTYSVGTDIMAGTYSSAAPMAGGTCYWKRMGGPSGTDIVDNALSTKPQVVQIDPTDMAFKTDGCQPWQQSDPATADGATPGDVPALIAEAQLHTYINTLNANALQFDGSQLPAP